jgi:Tfp pilus assembly protein PilF
MHDTDLRSAEEALRRNAEALGKMDLGDLEQAERLFKEGIAADANCGPVHNNLGGLYFRQNKLYLAALEFQCAFNLMPNQSEPANNLGLVYEKAHQLDQAVEWYEKAIERDADTPEILGNLARARLRRGDGDSELKKLLERLAIKDPRPEWSKWAEEQAVLMQVLEK